MRKNTDHIENRIPFHNSDVDENIGQSNHQIGIRSQDAIRRSAAPNHEWTVKGNRAARYAAFPDVDPETIKLPDTLQTRIEHL
jgi:hypothetical protein